MPKNFVSIVNDAGVKVKGPLLTWPVLAHFLNPPRCHVILLPVKRPRPPVTGVSGPGSSVEASAEALAGSQDGRQIGRLLGRSVGLFGSELVVRWVVRSCLA